MHKENSPAERLSLMPELTPFYNARMVSQRPYCAGFVQLTGEGRDDGAIPEHAPRERLAPVWFHDIVVPEYATAQAMAELIRPHLQPFE
jgi:hypothetical protein